MKPETDPRLPDLTHTFEGLPKGHPMRETDQLTLTQRFALPILLWFFDVSRNRGSGRSWLMAVILLELAKRGNEVSVEDLSSFTINGEGSRYRHQGYFRDIVQRVMDELYPNDIFEWSPQLRTPGRIRYVGRKPLDLR